MALKALYTVTLKGERHTYEIVEGQRRDRKDAAEMIGDLAGYKPEYIERQYLRKMKIDESITLGHDLGIGLGAIKVIVWRHR